MEPQECAENRIETRCYFKRGDHMSVLQVKEILAKTSRANEFKGSFTTQFPVKDVFEVRHEILPVRTLIGKKVIMYFGEILTKIFCINEENASVNLVEHVVHYRDFVIGEEMIFRQKPNIDIQSRMEDIFVEIEGAMQITVVGVVSTELSFIRDKIVSLSELLGTSDNVLEAEPEKENPEENETETLSSSSEIHTEVIGGINQELSITLK